MTTLAQAFKTELAKKGLTLRPVKVHVRWPKDSFRVVGQQIKKVAQGETPCV